MMTLIQKRTLASALITDNEEFNDALKRNNLTYAQVISEIQDALDNPAQTLGLSEDELILLARKAGSRPLKKTIFKKLSAQKQSANMDLSEEVGTSFTSTANVARYPVPLGMVRRKKKKPN